MIQAIDVQLAIDHQRERLGQARAYRLARLARQRAVADLVPCLEAR
ncbi:MAG TPA: hypothetical protein VIL37_08380 [Natronosporangium sp.]